MASIETLGRLTSEDRERYLWTVFQEAERFKQPKEQKITEVFRFIRSLPDEGSPYRATVRHPYAFSAAQTIKASIYPVVFSGDPPIQLVDPNADNFQRNQVTERLLGGLIKSPLRSNFPLAFEQGLDSAIWFGFNSPWTYFRSRVQRIGPRFVDQQGFPTSEPQFREIRTYHGPWLEHVDVWDTFLHPDGRRGFTRRDVTGYELLAQASGANPIYDFNKVIRMIRREGFSKRTMAADGGSFHQGSTSMGIRDQFSQAVGAEPPRHDEILNSQWAKDVLAMPFVLLHYDDDEYHGTYAVDKGKVGLHELRFFKGVNYDGSSNRLKMTSFESPQEIYGTSIFEVSLDLLKMHSNFYRAAADAAALQVHPMYVASQQFRMGGSNPVFGPGGIIYTPHVNRSLDEHFKRLETGGDFFQTFQLVDQIQRGLDTALSQGDPQRGLFQGGRKTAFETSKVSAGSQQRIEVMIKKLNDQFVVPLVRKWTAMMTEHYTGRDFVQLLGAEGASYIPPSTEEIINSLAYIPRGSLTSSDTELRQSRWPGIAQMTLQFLPFMQVPHVHELFKRIMADMQVEAVTRMIPDRNNPQQTEYMANIQLAMQQAGAQGGQPGQTAPPRSPGDISGLLAAAGGATAPPGPADGGRGIGGNNGL